MNQFRLPYPVGTFPGFYETHVEQDMLNTIFHYIAFHFNAERFKEIWEFHWAHLKTI